MDDFKEVKKREKEKLFEKLKQCNRLRKRVRYVVKAHTDWVDKILIEYLNKFNLPKKFTVLGVGGYGRRQLNPASDIDILILSEEKGDRFEELVRGIYDLFYFLGYECSVGFRSVDETIEDALRDDTIMTSLLDARFIYGDRSFFDRFSSLFFNDIVKKSKEGFIEKKLEYMKSRYAKYGNTVFVLEPNVKEGVGGLRDYHTLIWISKVLYGSKSALDMKRKGILQIDDYGRLRDALYFLWQVRNALHFENKRKNDILYLDMREKIAQDLGFVSSNRFSSSERLMRRYYYNTRNMERVVNTYINSFINKGSENKPFFYLDETVKSNGELDVEKELDFRQLLFLFYYSALYSKDISVDTLRKVKGLLQFVSKFRSDKTFAFVFKDILSLNQPITKTIRIMHEVGFLDRYIPEFGNVCCLTEDSLYHKYTVDEHSIQALGYLDELYDYDVPKTFVMRLAHIWKNLEPFDRLALRLAVLLHDIGKVEKEHHEIVGAQMVDRIAKRLRLGKSLKEKVEFLVRYHLLISRIVSTLDIEDPKTLEDFMKIVDSKDKLNLLMLLTYADMKAVNDNVWTSWKETLIETIYLKATYAFENKNYDEYLRLNALDSKRKIKAILGEAYVGLVDEFPDNIFNDIDFKSMAIYIRDIKDTSRNVFVYKESEELGKIVVYYDNKFGFFNTISGILACLDINIITAKSYNLYSTKIVDIFRVKFNADHSVDDYIIEDMLAAVESGKMDIEKCMDEKKGRFLTRLEKAKIEMSLQNVNVIVDNNISDLYTVVRIYAPDRIGLVYYITKVFKEFRFQVGMFILDTKGTMAVDTFYVVDENFRKIYSQKLVELLKSKLYEVLI
ncbi:bifunctional uridylyltransferase/uridylyl-removing protein GlnD [Hippea alviniae]|uniref:bifunctional uridylyltransferase/uridylyl-removing protein GlnD n=1 Tax=Hippea alviniae TaxID=1279027 RepID=UPI0003B58791|nr:HD domain-containing protein [Hippea alviniae]